MGKARTQVSAAATTLTVPNSSPPITYTSVIFTLWRLQEAAPTPPDGACPSYPCWIPITTYKTDASVDVESWSRQVVDHTGGGVTSDWSAWAFPGSGPGLPVPPLQCRPDGTCDPCSFFFKAVLPGPSCDPTLPTTVPLNDQCGKLAVLQLGGAINTHMDWK